jgi:hypothetical protein
MTCTNQLMSESVGLLPEKVDGLQRDKSAIDVGPVPRQFLTRADDFFGDRFNLTFHKKLIRGQVPG